MPGHYAHYRFASAQLREMDSECKKTVNRFRRLYDVGAQGPDPFFYFNPFAKNKVHELGHRIHMSPGRAFFERACRTYRLQPTEGGLAYLYGCLNHFVLDSVCHPYVNEKDASGEAKHIALETEFNRYLMELDGKQSPHTMNPAGYLTLTRGESETAASFYKGISAGDFARCMGSFKLFSSLFAAPEGLSRDVVTKVTDMVGYGQFIMTKGPDKRHRQFNEPMLRLYEQAMEKFPGMLVQLKEYLKYGTPLGEEFDLIYG